MVNRKDGQDPRVWGRQLGLVTVFPAILVLLALGADAQAADAKYEPTEIKDAFEKADPYVTQDFRHMLHFDPDAVKRAMTPRQIQIIGDFVALNNDYVEKVRGNPDQKHEFDKGLEEKFSKLRDQIGKSREEQQDGTDWVLPKAFAYADVCGGSMGNPHKEYSKMVVHTESDENAARQIVESLGYHEVSLYASNPLGWFHTLDYAKMTLEYNCNFGAFRNQIVLERSGDHWVFKKQIKEPNPEFLDYASPVWWWTTYTAWWHYVTHDKDNVITDWDATLS